MHPVYGNRMPAHLQRHRPVGIFTNRPSNIQNSDSNSNSNPSLNPSQQNNETSGDKSPQNNIKNLSITTDVNDANLSKTQSSLTQNMFNIYEQLSSKLGQLKLVERTLSAQAGQLLKKLQYEEAEANALAQIVRKIRHVRKKLLSRITNPRWEVKHHYHMTCTEHVLGHRQPHVMEVGEMLPGHLRLFALARCTAIIKKSLIYGMTRAKNERNGASDSIKDSYKQLRETRAEIKEVIKLLEHLKLNTHLFNNGIDLPNPIDLLSTKNFVEIDITKSSDADNQNDPLINKEQHRPTSILSTLQQSNSNLSRSNNTINNTNNNNLNSSSPPNIDNSSLMSNIENNEIDQTNSDGNSIKPTSEISSSSEIAAAKDIQQRLERILRKQIHSQTTRNNNNVMQHTSVRMRYFKSLNLAPKLQQHLLLPTSSSLEDEQKSRAETYNLEKQLTTLLKTAQNTQQNPNNKNNENNDNPDNKTNSTSSGDAELQAVQNARRRMGITNLPLPTFSHVHENKSNTNESVSHTGADSVGNSPTMSGIDANASLFSEGSPRLEPLSPSLYLSDYEDNSSDVEAQTSKFITDRLSSIDLDDLGDDAASPTLSPSPSASESSTPTAGMSPNQSPITSPFNQPNANNASIDRISLGSSAHSQHTTSPTAKEKEKSRPRAKFVF